MVAHEAADGFLEAQAHIIEPLGSYDIVDLKFGTQMLRARTRSGFVAKAGDRVFARLDPTQAHFFDTRAARTSGSGCEHGQAIGSFDRTSRTA